jgi:hypothetical protein
MPVEKRFVFSGNAVAFAGRIRRPDNVFVRAAAPSHLPVTGGLSEAKLEGPDTAPYHYKDLITFSAAQSRALGDYSDPRRAAEFTHGNHGENELPTNTAVEARLDNLKIDVPDDPEHNTPRRIFQAKVLDVHMESTSSRRGYISFRSLSARFDTITLTTVKDGISSEAELKVHTVTRIFEENDTKEKLLNTYAEDGDFRQQYAACFHPIGTDLPGLWSRIFGKHEIPYADLGPIVATFVSRLEWLGEPPEGTEIHHNRLTISGLGRIFFGEIVLDHNFRRATLLRFELGCPNGGDAAAVEVSTNGTHEPPIDPPKH